MYPTTTSIGDGCQFTVLSGNLADCLRSPGTAQAILPLRLCRISRYVCRDAAQPMLRLMPRPVQSLPSSSSSIPSSSTYKVRKRRMCCRFGHNCGDERRRHSRNCRFEIILVVIHRSESGKPLQLLKSSQSIDCTSGRRDPYVEVHFLHLNCCIVVPCCWRRG